MAKLPSFSSTTVWVRIKFRLEMLRRSVSGVEARAAATVPAAIGDASQGEVITPIFASGDGAFLGIESAPQCQVGDAAYPVLSNCSIRQRDRSLVRDEAVQTDATFVANGLSARTVAGELQL